MPDDPTPEQWRPYPDSPFEVSDQGNVRSWTWGRCRPIRPYPNRLGYLAVGWRVGRRRFSRLVHRMVLELFIGSCPTGQQSRHLNGKSKDNRLVNLAWGTALENHQDKLRHGTAKGLTLNQAAAVKQLLSAGWSTRRIAEAFGVSQPAVVAINRGRTHKDAPWPEENRPQWIS